MGSKAKKRRHNYAKERTVIANSPPDTRVAQVLLVHGDDLGSSDTGTERPTSGRRLPVEVWLMVLEYFPTLSVQAILAIHRSGIYPPDFRQRAHILRALSQTTRELRVVFLPLLWRDLEICTTSDDEDVPWRRAVAYALRRQCLGLVKTKALALHVRTLTVSLPQWSAHPVLKVFGRCLEAMQNLESLHIVDCNFTKEDLRTEFSKRRHPSVRKLTLPALACPILQACPKACEIELLDGAECSECMKTVIKGCPKVEKLGGVTLCDEATCHSFAKTLTKLSTLRLLCHTVPYVFPFEKHRDLTFLSHCRDLRDLTLYVITTPHMGASLHSPRTIVQMERCLAMATDMMRPLSGPMKKTAFALCQSADGQRIQLSEEVV